MRNSLYMSAAYTLIAVGAITIIISFLGCMGSFAENRILLLTYFVFVLLLFVVLLIGGVLAYVFRYQIANILWCHNSCPGGNICFYSCKPMV